MEMAATPRQMDTANASAGESTAARKAAHDVDPGKKKAGKIDPHADVGHPGQHLVPRTVEHADDGVRVGPDEKNHKGCHQEGRADRKLKESEDIFPVPLPVLFRYQGWTPWPMPSKRALAMIARFAMMP